MPPSVYTQVRVRPRPASPVSAQEVPSSPGADPRNDRLFLPATLSPSSPQESVKVGGSGRKTDDGAADTPSMPPPPPLHDTQAHLRSVHALLDSLPAEFRSTQPRRPLRPPPSPASVSLAARADPLLELPSPSEEPMSAAALSRSGSRGDASPPRAPGGAAALGSGRYDREPSSMPELRRMLSSLDRVDRRLFALGDGRGGEGDGDDDDGDDDSDRQEDVDSCAGADNSGRGRAGRERSGDDPAAAAAAAAAGGVPTKKEPGLEAATPPAEGAEAGHRVAVSRLQRAWRARSARKRRAAEAEVEAERESFALRGRRREEAAIAIQTAHRRAQARHRAAAAVEERRRRELRRRRRAAACAVLERAWRAFEKRRRAARELAEARGRAAAAVAAAAAAAAATAAATQRAEETTRGAVLVQAVWRGMSARAAVARRFEASRARSLAAAPAAPAAQAPAAPSGVPPAEHEWSSSQHAPSERAHRLATGIAPAQQPQPSTFYNQLSQDPRRRRPLPEAHLASAPSPKRLPPPPARSLAASHSAAIGGDRGKHGAGIRGAEMQQSDRFGPRPLARSAGAVRPPRFADQETARIARIMKGNLQHWATSARSSSSSDDVNL